MTETKEKSWLLSVIIALGLYGIYWAFLVSQTWSQFNERGWGVSLLSYSLIKKPPFWLAIILFIVISLTLTIIKNSSRDKLSTEVKPPILSREDLLPEVEPPERKPIVPMEAMPPTTPPPLPNISMAPTPQPAVELIDLNQASESDIATLPRINLILAKKIIQTREQLGGFTNFEQFVQEVNLPENTAEAIKDQVLFSEIERKGQPTRGRMVDY